MNKGKIVLLPIIIITAVVLCGLITGIVVSLYPKGNSIFSGTDLEYLKSMGAEESVDGIYRISETSEFGYEGNAEIKVMEQEVLSITFTAVLLDGDKYEKTNLNKTVADFVSAYSNVLGFEVIDEAKVIPFTSDEMYKNRPEDDYEALKYGFVMFEYSYRDGEGFLWIVQLFSPRDNELDGTVTKLVDETGYDGFVPQILMKGESK